MEVISGIGFGERSGAVFMALDIPGYGPEGTVATTPPPVKDYSAALWTSWGDDNLLPLTMADHIEHCGVLSAALDAKARIAMGKGIEPFFKVGVDPDGKDILEWCGDAEIHDWLEANDSFEFLKELSFDFNSYGWNTGSLILNKGRDKINKIRRIDVVDARVAKKVGIERYSTDLFLCADWSKSPGTYDTSKHVRIPLLQDGNEYDDLVARAAVGNSAGFEFSFTNRLRRNGRQNYPTPLWFAAEEWVKQARSIPSVKNAMFKNQILIRYIVTIHPQYWTDNIKNWANLDADGQAAQKKLTYDTIDRWLAGELNSGKTLFNSGFFEKATGKFISYVQVEAIDDKFKDGKWLPDSAASNSEILFATMVNPSLMGAGQPGGPYSNNAGGSNVREAYLVQIMIMDADRKRDARILNVVKKFNGWSKRLESDNKRLVWRYQSGLLTTLDTGKSTKPETTG